MNGATLRIAALREVNDPAFDEELRTTLMQAVRVALEGSDIPEFLIALGNEAELEPRSVEKRSLGSLLCYCGVSVTDDVTDNDADKYIRRSALGTIVSMMLFKLGKRVLAGELSYETECSSTTDFLDTAAGASIELQVLKWRAEDYIAVGERVAGCQFRAYCTMMWSGTPMEQHAQGGWHMGSVFQLAEDLRGKDERYAVLSVDDKREVALWASRHFNAVQASPSAVIRSSVNQAWRKIVDSTSGIFPLAPDPISAA